MSSLHNGKNNHSAIPMMRPRTSDQLDVFVIDKELRSMLEPHLKEAFKYFFDKRRRRVNNEVEIEGSNKIHVKMKTEAGSNVHVKVKKIQKLAEYIKRSLHYIMVYHEKDFISFLSQLIFFSGTYGFWWFDFFSGLLSNQDQHVLEQEGEKRFTPAMSSLGMKLVSSPSNTNYNTRREESSQYTIQYDRNRNDKMNKRFGILFVCSILLPILKKWIAYKNKQYEREEQEQNDEYTNINTNMELNLNSSQNNKSSKKNLAYLRQKQMIQRFHIFIVKALPLLRLCNFIAFLHGINNKNSLSSISSPPPTISMRIAGLQFANKDQQSITHNLGDTSNSMSGLQSHDSHSSRHINHIYFHRRLFYAELLRTILALSPILPSDLLSSTSSMSPTMISESISNGLRDMSLRVRRTWIYLFLSSSMQSIRKSIQQLPKLSQEERNTNETGEGEGNISKNKHKRKSSRSPHPSLQKQKQIIKAKIIFKESCSLCHIQPISIPYMALPCKHTYCYWCLRNAITDNIEENANEIDGRSNSNSYNIAFSCRVCGGNIESSQPLMISP